MKRFYLVLLGLLSVWLGVAAQTGTDTRTEVTSVTATSNIADIIKYGAEVTLPTVTESEGSVAKISQDNISWWKQDAAGEWQRFEESTFTEGVYKARVQVRVDGSYGTTHKLADEWTLTIDGKEWETYKPFVSDEYSSALATSPEMVLKNEDAASDSDIVKRAEINGLWYDFNSDKTATVIPSQSGMYTGKIVVPGTVNYENVVYTVTAVDSEAFAERDSAITSITLPATIKSIGESAFTTYYMSDENPYSLTCYAVTPPATTSTEDDPYSTFQEQWTVFGTLYVPDEAVESYKTTLPWSLFRNIEAISETNTKYVVSEGIRYRLYEREDGTPVASAESAEEITEVMTVSSTVTDENTGKEHTVVALGNWVFSQRSGIAQIVLPATIDSVGEGVFYGISTLERIICNAVTTPFVYDGFDEHCYENVMLVVPASALEDYKITRPWANFKNIIAQEPDPVYVVSEGIRYRLYEREDGTPVASAESAEEITEVMTVRSTVTDENTGKEHTVVALGNWLFSQRSGIAQIVLPATIDSVGEGVFYGISTLERIESHATTPPVAIIGDSFSGVYGSFDEQYYDNVMLVVPASALEDYKITRPWANFKNIIAQEPDPVYVVSEGIRYRLYEREDGTPVASAESAEEITEVMTVCSTVTDESTGKEHTVVALGNWVFSQRNGIVQIVLPETIETIGEGAFYGISSLEIVYSNATTPPTAINGNDSTGRYESFDEHCYENVMLVVPASALEDYKITRPWADFKNIIAQKPDRISVVSVTATSNIADIIGYGKNCIRPTFVMSEDSVANIPETMGGWRKKNADGEWERFNDSIFTEGVYQMWIQVRVDGAYGTTHKFANDWTMTVDGQEWTTGKPYVMDEYSYAWAKSSEIVLKNEEAAPDSNIVKRAEVNGLWYDLNPDKTAEVTANPNINYEGDVIICSKATDDEENEYTVTSIGDYAFAGQIGMNSITIPETVEKLGSGVFEECTGLTKIICESATPPSAISETVKPQVIVLRAARQSGVDGTFNDWCFENVELYVPKGSIDAYKSAEPWRKFKKIVESVPTGISVVPADEMGIQISGNKVYANGKQMQVYDVTGGIVYEGNASVTLQRGIYIIKAGGRSLKIKM